MHCGWTGELRSRDFERAYGLARCPISRTGWHNPVITVERHHTPTLCRQFWKCVDCGIAATVIVDPVADVDWDPDSIIEVAPAIIVPPVVLKSPIKA